MLEQFSLEPQFQLGLQGNSGRQVELRTKKKGGLPAVSSKVIAAGCAKPSAIGLAYPRNTALCVASASKWTSKIGALRHVAQGLGFAARPQPVINNLENLLSLRQ